METETETVDRSLFDQALSNCAHWKEQALEFRKQRQGAEDERDHWKEQRDAEQRNFCSVVDAKQAIVAELEKVEAERDRLLADVKEMANAIEGAESAIIARADEIDRLRAALHDARAEMERAEAFQASRRADRRRRDYSCGWQDAMEGNAHDPEALGSHDE